jgi:hypothetical protein
MKEQVIQGTAFIPFAGSGGLAPDREDHTPSGAMYACFEVHSFQKERAKGFQTKCKGR